MTHASRRAASDAQMEINAIPAAAAAAATVSDIYMTYDRNAKRSVDNRRQAHERRPTKDSQLARRSQSRNTPAVVWTTPGKRYDPIKRSCLHVAPVFTAALTAPFSPTAFASVRIFRCSVFAVKSFASSTA